MLHILILKFENGQSDWSNRGFYKLLFGVVKSHGGLEEWELLQPIVEEKVNRLIVEAEDQSLQKVDEVVGEFII